MGKGKKKAQLVFKAIYCEKNKTLQQFRLERQKLFLVCLAFYLKKNERKSK